LELAAWAESLEQPLDLDMKEIKAAQPLLILHQLVVAEPVATWTQQIKMAYQEMLVEVAAVQVIITKQIILEAVAKEQV
jgi:hypothetical protein